MDKLLEIQFPWKLIENLKLQSRVTCWRSDDVEFNLQISRTADSVHFKFSGDFYEDNRILIRKYFVIPNEEESKDLESCMEFHFQSKQFQTCQAISIDKLVTGRVDKSKLKRVAKEDTSVISSELLPDADEDVVNSHSFRSAIPDYAVISGSERRTRYTCKTCGQVCTSPRRLYCHLQLHGGFQPWTCAKCDYSAPYKSMLLRHTSTNHTNPGASSVGKREKNYAEKTDGDDLNRKKRKLGQKSWLMCRAKSDFVKRRDDTEAKEKVQAELKADGKKTVAIEIVIEEEDNQNERISDLNLEPASDTAEVVDAERTRVSGTDYEIALRSADSNKRSVDPRLRKVAKNYQFYIDEYCTLVHDEFRCKICSRRFRKRNQFMDHLYKMHEECQPYYCLQCDFRTRGKSNVFTHNSYKHNEKERPFSCECGTTCLTKSKYELHLATHKGRSEYKCEQCDSAFVTKHGRVEHIKRVHGERSYPCTVCGKKFSTAYSRKMHENVHQPGRRWKCLYCQKMYRSEQSLKIHMHSHTTVFHCQICDKDIYSYSAFIGHRNLHDPKTRKHPCSVCGKLFPSRKTRDKHVIVHHSEMDFEHKCQICEKSFKLLEQLNSHMICHSKSKPWICEVCGQAFKRQSTLCTHRNKHGQQNRSPFICTFCQQEFPTYPDLAEHLVREEKAGLCQYCHRLFSSKPLLDQHVVSAHHQETVSQQNNSTLLDYLTESVAEMDGREDEDKFVDHRVTVVGPSLINYDSEGQVLSLIEGVDTELPIQIAPSKVKTKVIHSGRNSSVVAQIRTTPVIEGTKLIPRMVNSQMDEVGMGERTAQTVTVTDPNGEMIDVPVITASEEQSIIEIIETT